MSNNYCLLTLQNCPVWGRSWGLFLNAPVEEGRGAAAILPGSSPTRQSDLRKRWGDVAGSLWLPLAAPTTQWGGRGRDCKTLGPGTGPGKPSLSQFLHPQALNAITTAQ